MRGLITPICNSAEKMRLVQLPTIFHLLLLLLVLILYCDLWSTIEGFSFPVLRVDTRASGSRKLQIRKWQILHSRSLLLRPEWLWFGRQLAPSINRASGRLAAVMSATGEISAENTAPPGIVITDGTNGSKLMAVNNQVLVIGKKTVDALQSRYGNLFDRLCSLYGKYPRINRGNHLHQQVMSCYPADKSAAVEKWANYFRENPQDKMVIIHLNSNSLDFNIENLMWGPERLVQCLLKSDAQPHGNNFRGQVRVNGMASQTKTCTTREEALHHVDILKLTSPNMPKDFLETVFLYGMNRPAGFEQFYDRLETLMDRATLPKYQKITSKQHTGKRKGRSAQYMVFNSTQAFLQDDRTPEELRDIILGNRTLGRPRCEPFSEEQDCIVLYVGAKGKKIAFVLEQKDLSILDPNRSLRAKTNGHVHFASGDQEYLHHLIMGYADGKQVSHGPGKALDNRRRTMSHASQSEINSNRGNPTSKYFGVYWNKKLLKWEGRLFIFEDKDKMYLGRYSEEAEAGTVVDFVRKNEAEFRLLTAGMTKKDRNAYIRHCARKQQIVAASCLDGTIPCLHSIITWYHV